MPLTQGTVDAPGFFGTRQYNSFLANEVEPSYLKRVYELEPNSDMVITGITAMTPSRKETNARFDWAERTLAHRSGTADYYEEQSLTTPVAIGTAKVVGDIVYAKISAALCAHFRERLEVRISQQYNPTNDIVGWVTSVLPNGANSVIGIKLLEAALNPIIFNANILAITGNVNPDGSHRPDGVSVQKRWRYNLCQTFRNPIKMDRRTALQTYRTMPAALEDERRLVLSQHALDIENAFIWGQISDTVVDNSRMTTTQGIANMIRDNFASNEISFYQSTDTDFAGKSWSGAGPDFVDQGLSLLANYGPSDRVCICGNGFLYGMNRVAKTLGTIELVSGKTEFGTAITRWVAPGLSIYFKTYHGFSQDETFRYSGLFLDPAQLKRAVITDTRLMDKTELQEAAATVEGFDGAIEGWLTDVGLQYSLAETAMLWHGIGQNNKTYVP